MSWHIDEGGTITREAEYVGSFEVTGANQEICTEYVKHKLLQLKNVTKTKHVALVLSLSGVKVTFDSFGQNVLMVHALKRISYATCNPELRQFSFLARNPKAPADVQHCHTFVTRHPQEAIELNAIVTDIFKTAYTIQCSNTQRVGTGGQSSPSVDRQLTGRTSSTSSGTTRSPSQRVDRTGAATATRPCSVPSTGSWSSDGPGPGGDQPTGSEQRGLGSISSLTESVNSWSFGLTADGSCGMSADTAAEAAASAVRSGGSGGGGRSTGGGSPVTAERCSLTDGDRRTTVMSSVDNGAVQTNTSPCFSSVIGSPMSSHYSPSTTPARAAVLSSSTSSSNHPPMGLRINGHGSHDMCLSTAGRSMKSRPRPLSGKFQNDELTLTDRRRQEDGDRTMQSTSSPARLESVQILGDGKRNGSVVSLDQDLQDCTWYMADIPREVALEILAQQDIGSFVVRNSSTNPGCFALSVKVPKYDNPTGISHYLLVRTSQNMIRFKGLNKEWSSVRALVTHHTVMRELLPCLLRLPRNASGTILSDSLHCDKENLEQQRFS